MKCENCGKEHDGSYGGGRFCCQSCAKSFSTKNCKKYKTVICKQCNKEFIVHLHSRKINYLCNECKKKQCKKKQYKKKQLVSTTKQTHRKKAVNEEFNFKDSPYIIDYDTAYLNYTKLGEPYLYLTSHNKNNKICKRHMVYLYRYIVELKLGRRLTSYEVIHHIDQNRTNNNIDNLIVLTRKIHNRLHKNLITLNDILNQQLYIAYFI